MEYIYGLLRRLGIGSRYRGYRYMALAVALTLENEDRLLSATKWLYPDIAHQCDTTWPCVERNLRTVVTVCWENGNRPLLAEIAGYPLVSKPTTIAFIDILVGHFQRVEESPPAPQHGCAAYQSKRTSPEE